MPIHLLDRRILFVTGKGGVGKSSVSLALGLLAARRGRRTIVAEVSSHEHLQRAFGHDGRRFEEVELGPGLFTISIDPEHAMEEYLRVKAGPIGQVLGHTRLFQALTMATPGMRELLTVGKIWELAQPERRTRDGVPYDLVIADAPSTGHGIGLIRAPRTFAEIARMGPIHHQGSTIAKTLADREFTAIAAVCTPEEMPVNETVALHEELVGYGLDLDAVAVNACYAERFADAELPVLTGALAGAELPRTRAALRAALSERARADVQAQQLDRLEQVLPGKLIRLPFLFAPAIGPAQLDALADALEDQLA